MKLKTVLAVGQNCNYEIDRYIIYLQLLCQVKCCLRAKRFQSDLMCSEPLKPTFPDPVHIQNPKSNISLAFLFLSGLFICKFHPKPGAIPWPNPEHLKILKQGVEACNKWREENPDIKPDQINADLFDANLSEADLSGADLSGAELGGAILSEANLHSAKFRWAYLTMADLSGANLRYVDLSGAYLSSTDLRKADLDGADLERTNLVETKLEGTNISNCRIYGISAWDLKISQETKQQNLVIIIDGKHSSRR
jgi:hypothetical protein